MNSADKDPGKIFVAFFYHGRLYRLRGDALYDGALLWNGLAAREGSEGAVRLLREHLDLAGAFLEAPPAPSEEKIAASLQAGPLLMLSMAALICAKVNVHPEVGAKD